MTPEVAWNPFADTAENEFMNSNLVIGLQDSEKKTVLKQRIDECQVRIGKLLSKCRRDSTLVLSGALQVSSIRTGPTLGHANLETQRSHSIGRSFY